MTSNSMCVRRLSASCVLLKCLKFKSLNNAIKPATVQWNLFLLIIDCNLMYLIGNSSVSRQYMFHHPAIFCTFCSLSVFSQMEWITPAQPVRFQQLWGEHEGNILWFVSEGQCEFVCLDGWNYKGVLVLKTCLGNLNFKTLKKVFNFNFCRFSLVRRGFDFPLIIPECDQMSSNPNSSLQKCLSLTPPVFGQIHCTCWMLLLLLDAISCC